MLCFEVSLRWHPYLMQIGAFYKSPDTNHWQPPAAELFSSITLSLLSLFSLSLFPPLLSPLYRSLFFFSQSPLFVILTASVIPPSLSIPPPFSRSLYQSPCLSLSLLFLSFARIPNLCPSFCPPLRHLHAVVLSIPDCPAFRSISPFRHLSLDFPLALSFYFLMPCLSVSPSLHPSLCFNGERS